MSLLRPGVIKQHKPNHLTMSATPNCKLNTSTHEKFKSVTAFQVFSDSMLCKSHQSFVFKRVNDAQNTNIGMETRDGDTYQFA